MKWDYNETLAESIQKSITPAVVNIKENYKELNPKSEKNKLNIQKFKVISGMFIIGFVSSVLANKNTQDLSKTQAIEIQAEPQEEYVLLDMPEEVNVSSLEDVLNTKTDNAEVVPVQTNEPVVTEQSVQVTEVNNTKATESDVKSEVPKIFETINEDVIGKAKDIIAMDPQKGNVVLDEFLKHHDEDTNEALLGTLMYIDPLVANNNIETENDYLHLRGININEISQGQGRGR